jgi:hypothetical protein
LTQGSPCSGSRTRSATPRPDSPADSPESARTIPRKTNRRKLRTPSLRPKRKTPRKRGGRSHVSAILVRRRGSGGSGRRLARLKQLVAFKGERFTGSQSFRFDRSFQSGACETTQAKFHARERIGPHPAPRKADCPPMSWSLVLVAVCPAVSPGQVRIPLCPPNPQVRQVNHHPNQAPGLRVVRLTRVLGARRSKSREGTPSHRRQAAT